jgi:hypothetical protein
MDHAIIRLRCATPRQVHRRRSLISPLPLILPLITQLALLFIPVIYPGKARGVDGKLRGDG